MSKGSSPTSFASSPGFTWRGPVLPGPIWFLIKVYALIFFVLVARWTFPRLRFDQLMTLAWKVMIPLAMANLIVTALVMKLVQ